jgi:L-alanine-DL-glutamate epimerase-like enolase superfamily enzyme
MPIKIVEAERIHLNVPFAERIAFWHDLQVAELHGVEIIRLVADGGGLVGYGETLPLNTWGRVSEPALQSVIGRNPADLLGDDSLGAGLQMALYDLVGKALDVPAHRLFNHPKVRDRCPIAWWNMDMPAEVMAAEAQTAVAQGYLNHKLKARPWFDIYEQVEAISAATPPHYRLDLDWNDLLLNAGNAAPVLRALEAYERVAIFEGPLPQRDVEGYRELRRKVSRPLAIHFGNPPFPTTVRESMCDGFVVAGGVASILEQGALCAAFDKLFWLQFIGTGLSHALAAHLGAVLSHAQWPAVTCVNSYADDLILDPPAIEGGYVQVPEGPGLGVTVDEEALTRYRIREPYQPPDRRQVISVLWPGGRRVRYAGMWPEFWTDFAAGNYPVHERGARLEAWADDGSREWAELYARLKQVPLWEGA